jgi:hypothetical protein
MICKARRTINELAGITQTALIETAAQRTSRKGYGAGM